MPPCFIEFSHLVSNMFPCNLHTGYFFAVCSISKVVHTSLTKVYAAITSFTSSGKVNANGL